LKATEVEVGDFISNDLGELFKKEKRLLLQFEDYCRQHNKSIQLQYYIAADDLFILKIKLKNGNNGEIKNC
jgi:hypothetical protein